MSLTEGIMVALFIIALVFVLLSSIYILIKIMSAITGRISAKWQK